MILFNKWNTIYIIVTVVTILSGGKTPKEQLSGDILSNMHNGETDFVVSEIYAEDIVNVETLTSSKNITIECYDYDLNGDENIDKVITVRSTLHSGAHGDSLDFLIGNADGSYRRVTGLVVPLYGQSEEQANAKMYILDSTTNGFHDLLIINNDGTEILLQYQNNEYEIITG